MYRIATMLILFVAAIAAPTDACGGVLDKISSEVREGSSDSRREISKKQRDDDHKRNRAKSSLAFNEDGGGFETMLGNVMAAGAWAAVTSPITVPRSLVEGEEAGYEAWFSGSPYDTSSGAMVLDEFETSKAWFAELQIDYGIGTDDVETTAIRFRSDFVRRLGVDTEAMFLQEPTSMGTDRLETGDLNLTWRFAQNERWQFRAGVGYNWLHDDLGAEHGINLTYSADWFPSDPLFVSSTLDLGTIGRASRVHGRAVIGVTKRGFGIYTGYDGLRIGDAKIHSWINGIQYRW